MQLNSQRDFELIARFVASGDKIAFDDLVHRHGPMVYRLCRRLTGNTHDAEDAAQKVFTILAQRAGEVTAKHSLAGWLYSTAWHVASHERRAQARRHRREQAAARPQMADAIDSIEKSEFHHELYRALEMLPPDYRDAIVLHHLEGLRIEDLAEVTGEPVGTVAARLSRGRAMIRQRLIWRGTPMGEFQLVVFLENELRSGETAPQADWSDRLAALPPPAPETSVGPPVHAAGSTAIATMTPITSGGWLGRAARVIVGTLQARAAVAIVALAIASGASASPGARHWAVSAADWVRTSVFNPEAKHTATASRDADTASLPQAIHHESDGSWAVPEPGAGVATLMGISVVALSRSRRYTIHHNVGATR